MQFSFILYRGKIVVAVCSIFLVRAFWELDYLASGEGIRLSRAGLLRLGLRESVWLHEIIHVQRLR